jgi:amidophosphoribosyltransferase
MLEISQPSTALLDGFDKPSHECGVMGAVLPKGSDLAAKIAFMGIRAEQHRGPNGGGLEVWNGTEFVGIRGPGKIYEVFPDGDGPLHDMAPEAQIAVAQSRYATQGTGWQPHEGIAHNGQINNSGEVAQEYGLGYTESDSITFATTLRHVYRRNVEDGTEAPMLDAMQELLPKIKGAFSLVVSDGQAVYGARDRYATRPLCIGKLRNGGYVVASETVALDETDAELVRFVEPGEIVAVDQDRLEEGPISYRFAEGEEFLCGVEIAYIQKKKSRHASSRLSAADAVPIGEYRSMLGRRLAEDHPLPALENPIVVGVPESGVEAAKADAEALGITYVQAIEKVRPDARGFMEPDQDARHQETVGKLAFYPDEIEGNDIVVEDDTVFRGTSLMVVVQELRKLGAKSVHVRIPWGIIRDGCDRGVDIWQEELLAYGRDQEGMREAIGADSLTFLTAEAIRDTLEEKAGKICLGCIGEAEGETHPEPMGRQRLRLPITPVGATACGAVCSKAAQASQSVTIAP